MARILPIVALAASLVLLAALAGAEPSASVSPQQGVLLLRNGNVLQGRVTRDGECYFVAVPHGEIRRKVDDVRWVGRSLSECYHYQRSALVVGNVNQHLELADWCITNGLFDEAQCELAEAARLDPRHPKLPLRDRQLKTARQRPSPRPAETGTAATTTPKDAVQPAEDLEALLRDLPPGAVETFTASIQPLLQNHCSTAGCHGPTSTSAFRLQRLPRKALDGRRLTQRNLHAVLQTIDREKPGNSPLLQSPIKPHGTAKEAVFKTRDASQYRQLVAWVHQVANCQPPRTAAGDDEQPPLLQPDSAASHAKRPGAKDPAPRQPAQVGASTAGGPPTGAAPTGAAPRGFTPRDPFDPELFNRRYFPDRARETEQRNTAPAKPPSPRGPSPPWSASPAGRG